MIFYLEMKPSKKFIFPILKVHYNKGHKKPKKYCKKKLTDKVLLSAFQELDAVGYNQKNQKRKKQYVRQH